MAGYVLATAFDEVWIQPGGSLGLLGVGVETTFLRGALDRLGIEPELEQRYEFKNAADQVMRTELTQAHRAALVRLAESAFTDAVEAIAHGRGLDPAVVRGLSTVGRTWRSRPGTPNWSTRSATATRRTQPCGPGSARTSSCCLPIGGDLAVGHAYRGVIGVI